MSFMYSEYSIPPGNARVAFRGVGSRAATVDVVASTGVGIVSVRISKIGESQTAYALFDANTGNYTQQFTDITHMPFSEAPGASYYFTIIGNTMSLYTGVGAMTGTFTHPALSTANAVSFKALDVDTYAGCVVVSKADTPSSSTPPASSAASSAPEASSAATSSSAPVTDPNAVSEPKLKRLLIAIAATAVLAAAAGAALFIVLKQRKQARLLTQ